jgi:hypothetical protein
MSDSTTNHFIIIIRMVYQCVYGPQDVLIRCLCNTYYSFYGLINRSEQSRL